MEYGCPGCGLVLQDEAGGRVETPRHNSGSSFPCHWSGRGHTVSGPTVRTPAYLKARRLKNLKKKTEEIAAPAAAPKEG